MSPGNPITALEEIREEIKKIKVDLNSSEEIILSLSKKTRQLQGNFMEIRLPKELESDLKANQVFLDQLNAQIKERKKQERALQTSIARRSEAEGKVNREIIKNREETRILNKALKDEAVLSSTLVGEYRKLEIRHNRVAKTVRDLSSANKENTREYRAAVSELKRLRAQLDKADKATNNFRRNVDNYQSALQKFQFAYRQFAGVFGVGLGIQIAREIFENVKAIEALDQALRAVTKTQAEYNSSTDFLLDISDRYGIEIRSLTDNYTRYLAALQGTNLEGDKGRRIFESLNRVSARLNLSQEKQNGILNAFVQIISKGTVQAEELRGQLGDRLPGAFNIMARAIGVSTEELNDMLKAGEVIADEVLPKFADELENTFGTSNLTRINNLVAAQNRLSNEWTKFLTRLTTGEGLLSSVFSTTLNVLTAFLKVINEVSDGLEKVFESEKVKASREEFEKFAKVTSDQVNSLNTYVQSVDRLGAALDQYAALQANISEKLQKDPLFSPELADETADQLTRLASETSNYNEFIEQSANIVDRNDLLSKSYLATLFARVQGIDQVIEATSAQIDKENELFKSLTDTNGALSDEGRFTARLRLQSQDIITQDEIDKAKAEIANRFKDAFQGFEINGQTIDFGIQVPNTDEVNEALKRDVENYKKAQEEKTEAARISAEDQKEIFGQLFSTFSNYYGIDLTLFNDIIDKKKALEIDYASTLKSISNAVLESRLIAYENEIVANQERLDRILSDENLSEEAKEQAQREADEKEKRIRTKQAKAERTNTLIQIGIDTAAAVAKVLAQTGVVSPLLIPGIIALGAAQAAFVASQPLPRFATGTKNAPEGPAITDELGPEMHLDRFGRIKSLGSDKGPRVNYLERGDKIIPAEQTKAILASNMETENDRIDMAILRMGFDMNNNIEETLERGIEKGFKKARINNKIINKIEAPSKGFH